VQANGSLAGALQVAATLPGRAGALLATGTQDAFINGVHLAAIVGVLLSAAAAVLVLRVLPRETTHHAETGAVVPDVESEVEALELAVEDIAM
jgi:MFS transporter, DHA2 family, multidrug resistance protein